MTDFGAINQFGSLTVNGKVLKFEDFDADKDGKVSSEEYKALLNEVKLDTVEFSSVDKNNDESLSAEEFAVMEAKVAMQDAVNNMAGQISKDFTGKTNCLTEVKNALKDFIEEFASNYEGDISKMAESFEAKLPEKYSEIKAQVLEKDPSTIKSKVLDEAYNNLISGETPASNAEAKSICIELEKEADAFIKSYKGTNLKADLEAHLNAYLNSSDATTMSDAVAEFKKGTESLGPLYDSNDLVVIKEYAKDLLTTAVEKGITVKLGDTNIKTTAAITSALNKYTDGEELMNAVNDAIESLNTTIRKESIIESEKVKAEVAAEKAFTQTKGEEYKVDPSLIDWTQVDGRYANGGDIYERGKGWSGSKDKAYSKGFDLLSSNGLKSQMRAQIESMLKSKGIPFDRIAEVFENIYNQTIQDTLNAPGMITGRGARGTSSKGKAYIDVKTLCDTFVINFNTNIVKAIDEMNASNTDMDLVDLDYDAMDTDENGTPVLLGEDFSDLYATGKSVTVKGRGSDYYVQKANQLIENMRRQMLSKARAMCVANGIEFDATVFKTMFNNAKSMAINSAVSGSGGVSIKFNCLFGKSSSSTLNTKTLIDTFTGNFKKDYTAWVEKEKAEKSDAK